MSIYGTFTAKKYFAQTLRDYLPAEVTAINVENPAAGLVLPVPTASDIVTYSLAGEGQSYPFTRSRVLVEVLCDDAATPDWSPSEVIASRLTQDHEVFVRLSVVDRDDGAVQGLYETVELMIAACDRVLAIERYELGNAPTIAWTKPTQTQYRNVDWDKVVRQATRRYTVRTQEVNT